MREELTKRREANLEISRILEKLPIGNLQLCLTNGAVMLLPSLFRVLSEEYPQQRAGQIICNYICPDYRSENTSAKTKAILRIMFPNDSDPFFEESTTTLNRLLSYFKNEEL